MARYDFGGTLADFVISTRRLGGIDVLGLSAATLTFWSAQSGGTRYADLVLNGSAVTSIAVGTDGQVPTFQGPDSVTGMWADGGAGRTRIVAQGIPGPAGPGATNGDIAGYLGTAGATQTAADARYARRSGLSFNVADYGGVLDGITDDRGALERTIAAAVASITTTGKGAVVQIPAGVLSLGSNSATQPTNPTTGLAYSVAIGVGLPVNLLARLTIKGAGRGVTTIKLSDKARNAFWINQTADYDTFSNVAIEDMTVDNNNSVGRCHVLIGSMPAASTSQRRLNYENLAVRRVDIINVPVDPTQATTAKNGVLFLGSHPTALEATQTHSTDITVEDFRMFGGDGAVLVCSWGAGSLVGGTNHYYNRIYVRRWLHSIPTMPANTFFQTSVYICGTGFGDYFEITDGESINIADDALEIGAMQSGLIDGVRAIDPFLMGILFRNSHALQDVNAQRIIVRNCSTKITAAGGGSTTGNLSRPIHWTSDNGLAFGGFEIESFVYAADGLTFSKQQQPDIAFQLNTAVARLVFNGLVMNLTNYTADTGSGTNNLTLFRVGSTGGVINVRDLRITASVAAAAGAVSWNLQVLSHGGSTNTLHVDGYVCDLTGTAYATGAGGLVSMYSIAQSGGTSVKGTLRRFVPLGPVNLANVGMRGVYVGSNGAIAGYTISDSDISALTGISAGRDIDLSPAGANAAKVLIRDVFGQGGVRLGADGRRSVAANYTMQPYDTMLGVSTTAAARTITLPSLASYPLGQVILIADESNAAGTNNITVTRAGTDTFLDGSTSKTVATNGGFLRLYSSGSKWQVV